MNNRKKNLKNLQVFENGTTLLNKLRVKEVIIRETEKYFKRMKNFVIEGKS